MFVEWLSKKTGEEVGMEGKLKISNEVLLNFDINTSVGNEYIFLQDDIREFFTKSPDFCNDFINYYFGE